AWTVEPNFSGADGDAADNVRFRHRSCDSEGRVSDSSRRDAAYERPQNSQVDIAVDGEIQLTFGREHVGAAGDSQFVALGPPTEFLDLSSTIRETNACGRGLRDRHFRHHQ